LFHPFHLHGIGKGLSESFQQFIADGEMLFCKYSCGKCQQASGNQECSPEK